MKKNKYVFVKSRKIYVNDKIYKEYRKLVNHENYLERVRIKNNEFNFSDFDYLSIENIENDNYDIALEFENKIKIKNLYRALNELDDIEKKVIFLLYFKNKTLREVAKIENVSLKKIFNIRNRILKKMKTYLKDLI